MKTSLILLFIGVLLLSCTGPGREPEQIAQTRQTTPETSVLKEDTVVDASLTFEEAIAGTKAPQQIIDQLILFDVLYLSNRRKNSSGADSLKQRNCIRRSVYVPFYAQRRIRDRKSDSHCPL